MRRQTLLRHGYEVVRAANGRGASIKKQSGHSIHTRAPHFSKAEHLAVLWVYRELNIGTLVPRKRPRDAAYRSPLFELGKNLISLLFLD